MMELKMLNVRKRLLKTPDIKEKVFIAKNATVVGDVLLDEDSSIWYNTTLRGDVEKIVIGKRSNVQDGTVIHVTKDKFPCILGDDVTLGHSVTLHGCTIDDNVLVGIGAIILDNAHIGRDSIVAAGAMVTPGKKFPPKSMIMGSPAKVVRELSDEEIAGVKDYADRYVGYKNVYLELEKENPEVI